MMNPIAYLRAKWFERRTVAAIKRVAIDYGLSKYRVYVPGHTESDGARVKAIVFYDDDDTLTQWAAWGCPGVDPVSLRDITAANEEK